MKYGQAPKVLKIYRQDVKEMMFYMYLPIQMKGIRHLYIPPRLEFLRRMILDCIVDHGKMSGINNTIDSYIYLTFKHMYVTPDNLGNRAGWHSDGIGSDDINYIWTDKFPTVFSLQDFDLSDDCNKSMTQMTAQAIPDNNVDYEENTLLRLDQYNIHRTPIIKEGGMRSFFKLSISKEKYNLKGNSHNYMIDYNWKMYDRSEVRNHPINKEKDSI